MMIFVNLSKDKGRASITTTTIMEITITTMEIHRRRLRNIREFV